jgi:hypothetical protein
MVGWLLDRPEGFYCGTDMRAARFKSRTNPKHMATAKITRRGGDPHG